MKELVFCALSIVFVCVPVAFMVTGKYEILFGGILLAAVAAFWVLDKKSKNNH